MSGPALSQQTFDVWREGDEMFKQEMRVLLRDHQILHRETGERLAALETNQEKCQNQSINRTTWVSALVAAIIGGLASWVSNR